MNLTFYILEIFLVQLLKTILILYSEGSVEGCITANVWPQVFRDPVLYPLFGIILKLFQSGSCHPVQNFKVPPCFLNCVQTVHAMIQENFNKAYLECCPCFLKGCIDRFHHLSSSFTYDLCFGHLQNTPFISTIRALTVRPMNDNLVVQSIQRKNETKSNAYASAYLCCIHTHNKNQILRSTAY